MTCLAIHTLSQAVMLAAVVAMSHTKGRHGNAVNVI